jgi:hypothetical protein
MSEPKDHLLGPGVSDMVDEESREQDQDEDTTHPFQRLYPYVFDIQSIFLIEAIRVFDLRPMAPLRVQRVWKKVSKPSGLRRNSTRYCS